MTESEYEAFKATERDAAKPGEWCHIHDDWQVNCGQDGDACWEDEQERRREREDEERRISCNRIGDDCTCDPDSTRCEGCGAPAVTEDDLGTPLCGACFEALPLVEDEEVST